MGCCAEPLSCSEPSGDRPRAIIHLNVADFAVAVERALDPRLRGRPALVAPEGAARAAVYDMSDEAYRAGVRKEMPLARARRLCPDAAVLVPHPERYERAMQDFLARALPYSPLVELVDERGHIFLDATGTGRLFGPPADVAFRIRREARRDLGLDPIWSVAPNKLLAKVATRLVKPTGEYILEEGEEEAVLAPLPVHLLPGLERDDLVLLRELELARVGELRRLSLEQLRVAFGSRARLLHETARGVDPSPVCPAGAEPPSVRLEHSFGDDTNDPELLEGALFALVERAGRELRRRRHAAGRVGVTVDHSDGVRVVRQATPAAPTATDGRLFELARLALTRALARRVRVRHLRLLCDRLGPGAAQLDLFAEDAVRGRRDEQLSRTLDRIRARFGVAAVHAGRIFSAGLTAAMRDQMKDNRQAARDANRLLLLGSSSDSQLSTLNSQLVRTG
jgi:DNA polymerase IV